ncbi:hypothetical protein V1511DRAFT_511073 [Dipodascopsis uninucleata]
MADDRESFHSYMTTSDLIITTKNDTEISNFDDEGSDIDIILKDIPSKKDRSDEHHEKGRKSPKERNEVAQDNSNKAGPSRSQQKREKNEPNTQRKRRKKTARGEQQSAEPISENSRRIITVYDTIRETRRVKSSSHIELLERRPGSHEDESDHRTTRVPPADEVLSLLASKLYSFKPQDGENLEPLLTSSRAPSRACLQSPSSAAEKTGQTTSFSGIIQGKGNEVDDHASAKEIYLSTEDQSHIPNNNETKRKHRTSSRQSTIQSNDVADNASQEVGSQDEGSQEDELAHHDYLYTDSMLSTEYASVPLNDLPSDDLLASIHTYFSHQIRQTSHVALTTSLDGAALIALGLLVEAAIDEYCGGATVK